MSTAEKLVAIGTAEDLMKNPNSITGAYLSGELKIPVPSERRKPTGFADGQVGAAENNLKNIDVKIPAWCHDLRDRSLRFGKELSDQ